MTTTLARSTRSVTSFLLVVLASAPVARAEDAKLDARDARFASQGPCARAATFFFGGFGVGGEGGLTNNTGSKLEPGATTPARFDDDEWVYKGSIGWEEKPIARDLYLMFWGTSAETLRDYRKLAGENDPWRWAWLDAFTFNATYSYGSTLTKDDDAEDFTIDTRGTYEVKLVYRVPLENACERLGWCTSYRDE